MITCIISPLSFVGTASPAAISGSGEPTQELLCSNTPGFPLVHTPDQHNLNTTVSGTNFFLLDPLEGRTELLRPPLLAGMVSQDFREVTGS